MRLLHSGHGHRRCGALQNKAAAAGSRHSRSAHTASLPLRHACTGSAGCARVGSEGAAAMTTASLKLYPRVDDWVVIAQDGRVTVRTGKVDIGQRISTALALIAAEELDVAYERIHIDAVDTSSSLDEEY